MDVDLTDLRALVFSDADLADICAEVLTVLAHGEPLVESLEFNEVDVTVDRNRHLITIQGVLPTNGEEVQLPQDRFVALASTIAEPLDEETLTSWRKHRQRRVWPMPPGST